MVQLLSKYNALESGYFMAWAANSLQCNFNSCKLHKNCNLLPLFLEQSIHCDIKTLSNIGFSYPQICPFEIS